MDKLQTPPNLALLLTSKIVMDWRPDAWHGGKKQMVVTITTAITVTTGWVAVRITITAATIIKRASTHPDTHFACTHLQAEAMEAQWVKNFPEQVQLGQLLKPTVMATA